MTSKKTAPAPKIGIFDSGLGGLTILQSILDEIPGLDILYYADQAHIPYGGRPAAEIEAFSTAIARFLLAEGAELVVVACNTATALAIDALRRRFPAISFVGVEPAVKPAVQATRTGQIGVLATAATLASPRYGSLKSRYGPGCAFFEDPCHGLVMRIERGEIATPDTRGFLAGIVEPWLAAGVDTLVLGCTHFPLITPLLADIAGPAVAIIDSGPAVARQTHRLLRQSASAHPFPLRPRRVDLLSSADPAGLAAFADLFLRTDRAETVLHSFPSAVKPGE